MNASFYLNKTPVSWGALLSASALFLASCSGTPPQASGTEASGTEASETSANASAADTATSILNAGVMTQMQGAGDEGLKFLFDPLYDDHFGSLQQLPAELIEAIVTGAPPYDGVDAVFVSHAHGDHFSASQLSRMMASQPQLQVVAPAQGIESLRKHANWQASFEDRVTVISLENGAAVQGIELPGAKGAVIEAFRSPHAGWPDRHAATHNITFRVSVTGSEGRAARVMHLGDADPAAEHYAALSEFLAAKRTGLAMVPFWFYREGDVDTIIDQTLNAQVPVAIHVPANTPPFLEKGELQYFSGVGQVLEIPLTQ